MGKKEASPAQKKAARGALKDMKDASDRFLSSIKGTVHPEIRSAHRELNLKFKALNVAVEAGTFRPQGPSGD